MEKNFVEQALEAGKKGDVGSWVDQFLLLEDKNTGLYEGLRKQKRYWVGPIEIELTRMPRITGPEDHMEYKVDRDGWEEKTKRIATDIQNGWKPAPLIAEYRAGLLSLRDGNHRREALEAAGVKKYWTVIWFNSREELMGSEFK